jgi:hypothetical protein
VIFSILHLVLAIRAAIRSHTGRFLLGSVGGIVRVLMMIAAVALSFDRVGLLLAPSLAIGGPRASAPVSPAVSLLLITLALGGPLLSFVISYRAWRRFQDVPAVQEEALQRPFSAWLPVGILDALYLLIPVGAAIFAMGD